MPALRWLMQIRRTLATTVVTRVHSILTSGMTPRKLVMTLCIGAAIGTMPLIWGTSLLCILLAHVFRLNHVALQSVNYLLYPLQLALLVPFYRLGAWLLPWGTPVPPHLFSGLFHLSGASLHILGWIMFKALAAWTLTALPAALLVYGVLRITRFKAGIQMALAGG